MSVALIAATFALTWATLAPAQGSLPIRIESDSSSASANPPPSGQATTLPAIEEQPKPPALFTAAKASAPATEPAPPPPATPAEMPDEFLVEEVSEKVPDFPTTASEPKEPVSDHPSAPASVPQNVTVTPAILQPVLEIRHEVPKTSLRKDPIPVRITVTNHGAVAANNVVVSNDLGIDVEMIHVSPKAEQSINSMIWALGTLDPGASKVIEMTVIVKPNAKATVLQNAATVTYQVTSMQQTLVHSPKLKLTIQGPDRAIVGEAVQFTMEVSNIGDAPATNVVLKDPLPEGLVHPYGPDLENDVGDLAPGEARSIKLSLTPTMAKNLVNRVVVTADGTDPVEAEATLAVEEIRLAVESRGPKVRYLNRPCTYEIVVTNPGETEAKDVVLQTTMPNGLGFVHASGDGIHDNSAHAVVWRLGTIKPSEEKVIALTGLANQLGDQVFHATLKAANNFHQESNWTTSIQGVSALQVEVIDVDDPLEVGADGLYEIRVTNQGTVDATNLKVAITIPPELEPTAADGPTGQQLIGKLLTFEPIEKLAPKADVTYRIKVRGTKPGDCRFRCEVTTDQLSKPVLKEESTTVYGDEILSQ